MIFFYNILQFLLLPLWGPVLLAAMVIRPKYRRQIPQRLGRNLKNLLNPRRSEAKVIWIHALSVGEVTSSLPLVKGIRETMDASLIFSVTTRSGAKLAKEIIVPHVDSLIPFPIDIFPITRHFLQLIRPDLFILVETDFWPNLLFSLAHKNIPALLVNGRISEKSMNAYKNFRFFFKPLFSSFSLLCMQTERDRRNMIELGVYEKRVVTLGNLKYDLSGDKGKSDRNIKINPGIRIVAGSTHRGEEKILLLAFKKLMERYDNLSFVIAPRDIDRGKEILDLATSLGFTAACRSEGKQSSSKNVYILNIIGELVEYYHTCDIAFVGGSLVEAGGHNPIEPAITGVPVLFGPHMEDFSEISEDLLASTAAIRVYDSDSCYQALHALLKDGELRNKMGLAAKSYIREKQGVTEKHLQMIRNFL